MDLARRLGTADAAALYVGIILGSGIFVAPAAVAGAVPGPAGVLPWLLGAVVCAAGASCYAECGARLPRTGGFYAFHREAYGPVVAFTGGWAGMLVTYPASMAAIALVCAGYAGQVVPALAGQERWTGSAALLLAGLLNVLGVRAGAWTQRLLTATKVGALALLCLAAAWGGGRAAPAAPETPVEPALLLGALVALLWTYDGWSDVTLVAGEVRDPGRSLGKAVLLGTAVLAGLYALVQLAVALLLPADRAAGSQGVVSEAVRAGLGEGTGVLVALLVVVATFGSIHGVSLTASRLGYAMARDGSFFPFLGAVSERFGTPARSVLGLTAASLVYVHAAGFRKLLAFFSFNVWIFYGLTAAAVLILRRRKVGEPPGFRAPFGATAPVIVLATGLAMTVGLGLQSPREAAIGLGMLVLGALVAAAWRRGHPGSG